MIIPVVFATDINYIPYCGVAISSLIENANTENKYELFVFYYDLPKTSIYRLESLSNKYVKVRCVCISEYVKNLKVLEYNHLTIASAYRLIIPDVLPQYDKVLYLDSDIIVNEDVSKLYEIDTGDCILGAVKGYYKSDDANFMYRHITEDLHIDINNFFNAGILIINTKLFKEYQVKEKCFSLLSNRKDLYFMDQCAMNIVCENQVSFFPLKWNFEWQFLFASQTSDLDRKMFASLQEKKAVIHYDGIEKPWDYPEQILADVFWKYARKSIFYEEILNISQIKRIKEVLEILGGINTYKNIVLYGAGNIGKKYAKRIIELKLCNIVAWVDRNYKNITETLIPVNGIERIFEVEFDHIIITIANRKISANVRDMLVGKGIPAEKIVSLC